MNQRTAVIIPAAGSGSRMQTDTPKQFLNLAGKPLLVHSISTFANCPFIEKVVVPVSEDMLATTRRVLARYNLDDSKTVVVAGGSRRQDSVKRGLDALGEDFEIVLVHDAARPMVSADLIERVYKGVIDRDAAIAAIPVKDTLKKSGSDKLVLHTVDRNALWQAQTPQGARKALLEKAFLANGEDEVTDESSLLEKAGISVLIALGDESNFKITRKEDLVLAESILSDTAGIIRIGHGFDAHRFADGRALVLGGVDIQYDQGLAGHSDADVVCHALCDALLGAIGCGDIGTHFPDNDVQYKGISSLILVDKVIDLYKTRDLGLNNADITIICQAPKLAPHIESMKAQLAKHCRVKTDRINIKATTTEKMGYTGRGEGISCHAVVLVGPL